MILGASRIKELIVQGVEVEDSKGSKLRKPLIEGLSDEQLHKMEGTTVDLRLGEIYRLVSGAKLMVDSRITPQIESVLNPASEDKTYTLPPGELVLVQTMERVNLPGDLLADVRTRTTLFRCGLFLKTSYISPNYQGVLTFALHNLSSHPTEIERGFRIACISFSEISGEAVPYHGVWQGKRASTDGEVERPY
jgi:deoxycytidine triphosphate deaminase